MISRDLGVLQDELFDRTGSAVESSEDFDQQL